MLRCDRAGLAWAGLGWAGLQCRVLCATGLVVLWLTSWQGDREGGREGEKCLLPVDSNSIWVQWQGRGLREWTGLGVMCSGVSFYQYYFNLNL